VETIKFHARGGGGKNRGKSKSYPNFGEPGAGESEKKKACKANVLGHKR